MRRAVSETKLNQLIQTSVDEPVLDGVSLSALENYWAAAAQEVGLDLSALDKVENASDTVGARRLVDMLIQAKGLELVSGVNIDDFAKELGEVLANEPDAAEVSDWLLDRDEVEELYLDEPQIERLLTAW